jgi:hypothetical protein
MLKKIYNALAKTINNSLKTILKLQNEIRTFLLILLLCFLTISIVCKGIDKKEQIAKNNYCINKL